MINYFCRRTRFFAGENEYPRWKMILVGQKEFLLVRNYRRWSKMFLTVEMLFPPGEKEFSAIKKVPPGRKIIFAVEKGSPPARNGHGR